MKRSDRIKNKKMYMTDIRNKVFELIEKQKEAIKLLEDKHSNLEYNTSVIDSTNQYFFIECSSRKNIKRQIDRLESIKDFVNSDYSVFVINWSDLKIKEMHFLTGEYEKSKVQSIENLLKENINRYIKELKKEHARACNK